MGNSLDFLTTIAPFTPDSFFNDYWEKRPLVISGRSPNYYAELMTLADVDRILYTLKPNWTKLRLVDRGRYFMGNFMHPDGTPNIAVIYQAYNQGYSLNLLEVQERWSPLAAMVRNWETSLHHPISVNLYLTPQNSKAFHPHFDNHDVFILQIEGEKDWQVWQPTVELPGQEFTGNPFLSKDHLPSCLIETRLKAGDLLYLPRGWGHAASTSERTSLHLTFGVSVYTWSDLLDGMLEATADRNEALNCTLPVGFMRDEEVQQTIKNDLDRTIADWIRESQLEAGINRIGARLIKQMKEPLPNQYFSNIEQLSRIHLKTIVKKTAGTFCHIIVQENEITVNYPGNQLKLAKSWENAIKDINLNLQIIIEDFPGTNSEKLLLARQMVTSGLLAIETEESQ
ncbi:MAG TPA: cupin domain-containing protein [Coleofasciculaceae cyanobacterium]